MHTPSVHVSARWSIPWEGNLAQVVPFGERLVIAGSHGERGMYAIVATRSGRIAKRRNLDGCTPRPAAGSTMLLAVCGRSELVLVDPETLEPRWRTELGGGIVALSAAGDRLFATTREGERSMVFALDADGEEQWRAEVAAKFPLFISEDPSRVYVFETDPTVWGFERDSGEMLWSYPTEKNISEVNPKADGTLEVLQQDGLVTLESRSGRVIRGPVAPPDGVSAETGTWRYRIVVLDEEDGSFRARRLELRNADTDGAWRYDAPVNAVKHVSNGTIYTCSETGILHVLDVVTGDPRWWADVGPECDVTPVRPTADSREWQLARLNGRILAFDPSRPSRAPREVTVKGRFRDALGDPQAGVRIWIGDEVVTTDAKGRFRAKVQARSAISVTVDPRDINGASDPVVILAGRSRRVELSAYYEPG